jgi:hypothetical protein
MSSKSVTTASQTSIASQTSSASQKYKSLSRTSFPKSPKSGSKASGVNKQMFQVRVSLGYLTGIKMEQLSKKTRRGSHNALVVGYASLAKKKTKTKKQQALSQPLVPSLGDDAKTKQQKIIWANRRGGQTQMPLSIAKRRLYFSLLLELEDVTLLSSDDDSVISDNAFLPEVVKIEIGVKCGDQKIPLGSANLVINGNEATNHRVDMAVRPVQGSGVARRGLFGASKRQQNNFFSNGDFSYGLASNATLRVRLDVKPGMSGQGPTWGDSNGDDESYVTNYSLDPSLTMGDITKHDTRETKMRTTSEPPFRRLFGNQEESPPPTTLLFPSKIPQSPSLDRSFLSEWVEVMPELGRATNIVSSASVRKEGEDLNFPIRTVLVRKRRDAKSIMSGLTQHDGFQPSCLQMGLCGDEFGSPLDTSFSFESSLGSLPSYDPDVDQSSSPPGMVSSSTCDDRSSDESSGAREDIDVAKPTEISEANKANIVVAKPAEISEANQANIVVVKLSEISEANKLAELAPIDASNPADTESKTSKEPLVEKAEEEKSVESEVISLETFADLKDAQEILLRYALKAGINMEDLLAGMGKKERKQIRYEL